MANHFLAVVFCLFPDTACLGTRFMNDILRFEQLLCFLIAYPFHIEDILIGRRLSSFKDTVYNYGSFSNGANLFKTKLLFIGASAQLLQFLAKSLIFLL